jgi:hypothetical protein
MNQGVTKRCRLSDQKRPRIWAQMRGGDCGVAANEYSFAQGAQINCGDLIAYLNYEMHVWISPHSTQKKQFKDSWKYCAGTVHMQV